MVVQLCAEAGPLRGAHGPHRLPHPGTLSSKHCPENHKNKNKFLFTRLMKIPRRSGLILSQEFHFQEKIQGAEAQTGPQSCYPLF